MWRLKKLSCYGEWHWTRKRVCTRLLGHFFYTRDRTWRDTIMERGFGLEQHQNVQAQNMTQTD